MKFPRRIRVVICRIAVKMVEEFFKRTPATHVPEVEDYFPKMGALDEIGKHTHGNGSFELAN